MERSRCEEDKEMSKKEWRQCIEEDFRSVG